MAAASKPSVSPARTAAFDILLRVHKEAAFASELLHSERLAKLSPADRALCTELVMGVLRWQSALDGRIQHASAMKTVKMDPEVLVALRMGVYQLLFLERVPHRAAVHESVELVKRARKRSAVAFANAVLRKLDAEKSPGAPAADTVEHIADRFAHPPWLVERWVRHFGFERARAICDYDQHVPQTTVRLDDPSSGEDLRAEDIELAPGAFLRNARRVLRGDVTASRACRGRKLFIQDEASQLVAALVGKGRRILDCCAAPGGKTSAIAARNPQSFIVAAELHPHRAWLARRLVLSPEVHVIAADAKALPLAGGFDRVLADVPCSGTGTLARNPEIKWKLRPADLPALQVRQVAILSAAVDQLAPCGRLVYSTCSLEPEENLQVVGDLLAERTDISLLDCRELLGELQQSGELTSSDIEGITQGRFLRTLPGVHPCDGFFAAVLQKAGG